MQAHIQDLLEKFYVAQEVRSLSATTIETYQQALTEFFDYCEENELDLQDIEQSDLRAYIGVRVQEHGNSIDTVRKKVNAVRQFMKWGVFNKLLEYDPTDDFPIKRTARPLPGMLDIETINRIMDQGNSGTDVFQWSAYR